MMYFDEHAHFAEYRPGYADQERRDAVMEMEKTPDSFEAVSYTHQTLPTRCSV